MFIAVGPSPTTVEALTEQVWLVKGSRPVMVRLVLLVLVLLMMLPPELQVRT